MALNPPINSEGQPMRVEGEYFAILRKNMEIEVKIEGWAKQTAKGKLYVTTARLVFVNDKHDKETFKSFDIPLLNIVKEKFEQPIFGANYLSLTVKPLFGLIPGDAKVKIWFMSGGCQKFLDIFLQILPQIRKRKADGADPRFVSDLTNGNLSSKYAYVDPSDPTVVFVTQPVYVQSNSQMNDYYSKFPDTQPDVNYAPSSDQISPTQNNAASHLPQGGYQQQTAPTTQVYNQYEPTGQAYVPQNNQGYGHQQYAPQSNYQPQGQQQQQSFGQQQVIHQAQPPQPNVGYYYGFWGPQLQNNGPR